MTLRTDLVIACAVLAAIILFALTGGNGIVALLPIVALALLYAAPFLLKVDAFTYLLILVFLMFTLDSTPKAFYSYDPITEFIGTRFLFGSLNQIVPGLPSFTVIEVCVYGLIMASGARLLKESLAAQKHTRTLKKYAFTQSLLATLALPAFAYLGVVTGVLTGSTLSMGLMQTRPLTILPLGAFIGCALLGTPDKIKTLLRVMAIALTLKGLQGIYAFYGPFGGALGTREYLLEHETSDFFMTAITFLATSFALEKRTLRRRALLLLPIAIMLLPYFINDRRVSLIGVVFGAALLPLAFPTPIMLRILPAAATSAAGFFVYLAATWNMDGPLAFASRTIRSFLEPEVGIIDYRDVENYNLFNSIIQNPLVGLGYGKPIPFPFQTFDFSKPYALFDVFPHNSFLYTWTYGGPLGVAGLGLFFVVSLATMTRLVRRWGTPAELVVGITGFTMVVRWLMFVNGDMGLLDVRNSLLNGMVFGGVCTLLARREQKGPA